MRCLVEVVVAACFLACTEGSAFGFAGGVLGLHAGALGPTPAPVNLTQRCVDHRSVVGKTNFEPGDTWEAVKDNGDQWFCCCPYLRIGDLSDMSYQCFEPGEAFSDKCFPVTTTTITTTTTPPPPVTCTNPLGGADKDPGDKWAFEGKSVGGICYCHIPSGETLYRGQCLDYGYTTEHKAKWKDGDKECIKHHTNEHKLVIVETYDELARLEMWVAAYGKNKDLWLGATDQVTEGQWVWNDGVTMDTYGVKDWFTTTVAGQTQFNQPSSDKDHDCLLMSNKKIGSTTPIGFVWVDEKCDEKEEVLCEYESGYGPFEYP